MLARKFVSIYVLFVCLATASFAQSVSNTTVVPLTVDEGFPLHVIVTEKFRLKENEPVRGKIMEPVYAFDREVVPAGSVVTGKVTGFQAAGKWRRISRLLSGDFTPVRIPQITFDTLVLTGGARIPIATSVFPGAVETVQLDAYKHQPGKDLQNSLASTVKQPVNERVKNLLWGLAPYHPSSVPTGTRLDAVLIQPLHFGDAIFDESELTDIGSELPGGNLAYVRLITPLDSGVSSPGASVRAQLTRPLFSAQHRLLYPAGSMLVGKVMDVNAAQARHHHGQLTFSFTEIEPPVSMGWNAAAKHAVEGSLVSVDVSHEMKNLRISEQGATRIVESKKRFIGPAWAFIKAERSFGASSHSFDDALLNAYRGKALKQIMGTESTFGLPGSISGAMVPPLGIGLGIFGAARSVYSNFLGRGQEITLPANTSMQVRLATPGNHKN